MYNMRDEAIPQKELQEHPALRARFGALKLRRLDGLR